MQRSLADLEDSVTVAAETRDPQRDFGRIRLWGTIGWIAASWVDRPPDATCASLLRPSYAFEDGNGCRRVMALRAGCAALRV